MNLPTARGEVTHVLLPGVDICTRLHKSFDRAIFGMLRYEQRLPLLSCVG